MKKKQKCNTKHKTTSICHWVEMTWDIWWEHEIFNYYPIHSILFFFFGNDIYNYVNVIVISHIYIFVLFLYKYHTVSLDPLFHNLFQCEIILSFSCCSCCCWSYTFLLPCSMSPSIFIVNDPIQTKFETWADDDDDDDPVV